MVEELYPDSSLLERIGGESVVASIVNELYDRIEVDPELRPLFRHDLSQERLHQRNFFTRWMGGEKLYQGYRGLRSRHRNKVSVEGARLWLGHFTASLKSAQVPPALVAEVMRTLVPLANALVDDQPMLQCQEWYRKPAADVARGDLDALKAWVAKHPELLQPGPAQLMMHMAARRGRAPIVEYLLDRKVDPNLPNCTQTEVAVSPYAVAWGFKHFEVADMLLARGGLIDVFTLAWVGDLEALGELLDVHPELLEVNDPAQDFQEVRPLEHAVERGQVDTVEFLLERGADLQHRGAGFVSRAVGKRRHKLLKLLLQWGASVKSVGPGRWLIDEKLAPSLLEHGVKVKEWGADWVEMCTGHHGNREQPELIKELLKQGVDLEARANKGRTALHCATRVGYTKVLEVLLEAGADVEARDQLGNTPLHYVFLARPKVDKRATAELLLRYGADVDAVNEKGESPRQEGLKFGLEF